MLDIPHAPGYTLAADAFLRPGELVGFVIEHHFLTVFSHTHEFHELALVLSGSGVHTTDEGSRRASRGSVVFVAPGLHHGWEHCDDMTVYNCVIRAEASQAELWWALRDPVLGRLFAPGGLPPRRPLLVELAEDEFAACHRHLESIRLRPRAERGRASDVGNLLLALDVVGRRLAQDAHAGPVPLEPAPPVVARAMELIEADLRRRWTLEALEQELAVGRFHLVRLFRRWVGVPPIAYVNRRRAERAALALVSTDAPIATVGADVGWADPSSFARSFGRHYGLTPRAYRARRTKGSAGQSLPTLGQAASRTAER